MDTQRTQPERTAVDAGTACRELTLALLFLNRWKEVPDKTLPPMWRSWKGYDFDDLDVLEEAGFLQSSRRAKSVYFTDEGLAEARRILAKYGIEDRSASSARPGAEG